MENQTFGGVSPIDFIKSNFSGAFNIKRLEEINPSLGKALMVVRRGSMLDMPDIGSIAGMEPKSESNVGIIVKLGAPADPPRIHFSCPSNCNTCKKVESMPYCLPGHYCDGGKPSVEEYLEKDMSIEKMRELVARSPVQKHVSPPVTEYTAEEHLFRAIAKDHIPGRLTVIGGKQMDATRFYQVLGLVDEAFALEYKLVSVEMMYLYDSFPQGIQPETGLATEKVYSKNQVTSATGMISTFVAEWTPEKLQVFLDEITNAGGYEEE